MTLPGDRGRFRRYRAIVDVLERVHVAYGIDLTDSWPPRVVSIVDRIVDQLLEWQASVASCAMLRLAARFESWAWLREISGQVSFVGPYLTDFFVTSTTGAAPC